MIITYKSTPQCFKSILVYETALHAPTNGNHHPTKIFPLAKFKKLIRREAVGYPTHQTFYSIFNSKAGYTVYGSNTITETQNYKVANVYKFSDNQLAWLKKSSEFISYQFKQILIDHIYRKQFQFKYNYSQHLFIDEEYIRYYNTQTSDEFLAIKTPKEISQIIRLSQC